jgi:hypothetical protein
MLKVATSRRISYPISSNLANRRERGYDLCLHDHQHTMITRVSFVHTELYWTLRKALVHPFQLQTEGLLNGHVDRDCDKADFAKVVNPRSKKMSGELLLEEAQALMLVCQVEVHHRKQACDRTGTTASVVNHRRIAHSRKLKAVMLRIVCGLQK